jgi:predicted porin|tara:strand:- start:4034 stop:5152 length:1119 start_codon:yes stop_codon:yes gene_type:complete
MNKALLASTALVGAALLSAPAMAGSVGTGKNMSVNLNGMVFFQAHVLDGGPAGDTRGYDFDMPEAEAWIKASNKGDNGITYGVRVELEINTDQTTNADEIYAFLKGDFGTVELGDNDGVSNQWLEGAHKTHAGASGPFGGLMGLAPVFLSGGHPKSLARTDWQPWTSSDRTKVTYMTPKFSGFQAGVSYTPDGGANGASFGEKDNNGSFENMMEVGLRYGGKFNDVGVNASLVYESAGQEAGGTQKEDLAILAAGARFTMGKVSVGANFRDNGNKDFTAAQVAAGADGGSFYAVGAGYNMGKGTKTSLWFSSGSDETSSTVSRDTTRWGLGAQKVMAPGWILRADYNSIKTTKTGSTDSDQQAVILTNFFLF